MSGDLKKEKYKIMKITKEFVKRELQKNYGWSGLKDPDINPLIDDIITDIINIIHAKLFNLKRISIKGK